MQADDDTFVIVENLRYFLSSHDPSEPVWFGHHFKTIVRQVSSRHVLLCSENKQPVKDCVGEIAAAATAAVINVDIYVSINQK